MKAKLARFFTSVCLFCFISEILYAQNCVPTGLNNTIITSTCDQSCRDFNFQIPDLRSTSTYTVISIPYTPYPFVTAGGTVDSTLYNDDAYSKIFNLPFPFCFFDSVYTQAVIGSNGLISFDISNAGCTAAGWEITNPIPFSTGGTQCFSSNYYPKASIMGAFMDLDARINLVPPPPLPYLPTSSPADRKIEWRVEGTAPCRRFVVSFYHIGVYEGTQCGNTTPATFEMVMTESTGVIDVFIENKSCPALSSNFGANAILGIQNFSETQAVAAPGKNATVWTSVNEGYRFVPSGGTSRFVSSELLAMDLSHVSWATTSNTTPGLLNLDFPNICSTNPFIQYIVKTIFSACDNPVTQLISMDTITVNYSNHVNATAISTNTSCGPPIGSITVTVPAGVGTVPYSFQLDADAAQTGASPFTFNNVSAGLHSVVVTDLSGHCTDTINLNVGQTNSLTATITPTSTSCPAVSNGNISVTSLNGASPYTFTLNPGGIIQTGNTASFTGLTPGSYTISIVDANGCSTTTPLNTMITSGPVLSTSANHTDISCNGGTNGSITIIQPLTGTAPYQYSLDGLNWQAGNIFSGLTAGNYNAYYEDNNGCKGLQPVTILQPNLLSATLTGIPVKCNGQSNGLIVVNASGGVSPYKYSIDGGANQNNDTFYVASGNHTVSVIDNNGCVLPSQPITITQPAILTANAITQDATCSGGNNGTITITANGGNSGYQYSSDGITFQPSNVLNVGPGNYTAIVKDNLGCTTTVNATVGLTNDLTLTPQTDKTICEGTFTQLQLISNATQYLWTPAIGLSSNIISNPLADPLSTTQYIVTATLGPCSANDTVLVNVNPAPVADAGPDGNICYGQSYQLQASGSISYNWTPSSYLSSAFIPDPIVTKPKSTITYSLTVVDAIGCQSINPDSVTVNVTPPIHVITNPSDTIVNSGDQVQLLATSVGNIYSWSPTVGLSDPNIPDPVLTSGVIGDVTIYTVTASTIAGCAGEGYVKVEVYKGPDIYVPTGFTPNNDGKNDKFTPVPVGIKELNYFKVFNRWGQLVFSTTTLNYGWDGKFAGMDQPAGVYVWMLKCTTNNDKEITKKGTVALIR